MRLVALMLILAMLTGCSLVPDTYLSVEDHIVPEAQKSQSDAITVRNYSDLKRAILSFVEAGQSEGTIWTSNYDGPLEDDLIQAAYEVSKLNPLGAYAVDYMTHDCTFIVNYYEINIRTTFRRTLQEMEAIEPIATQSLLQSRIEKALEQHETRLALRLASYRDWDVAAMVAEYCAAHPDTIMEQPAVTLSVYPDSGTIRILEIDLQYTHTAQELERMKEAVQESVDAAAEYIRYRQSDREKTDLLFTYLMERFTYIEGSTATPLYDALCAGIADPAGLAHAWQLICDTAGVPCHTVTGLRNGQPHTWNIVGNDGYFRHVDLARCMLERGALVLQDDLSMGEYYWSTEQLPACVPYPEDAIPSAEETPAQPQEHPSAQP